MSSTRVILLGGGEHGRVVGEAAVSSGSFNLIGFVDPCDCPLTERTLGVTRLRGDEAALVAGAVEDGVGLLLGVGELGVGKRRRAIVEAHAAHRPLWPTVVHAAAWVSPSALLGRGAVIMAGAVVNARAVVGDFVVVNSGAVVEHDVVLGAFSQVSPSAAIGGGAVIGDDAYVGLGSRVRDHVTVGARAQVAMGAAVVADVAEGLIVMGIPAKPRSATRIIG